MLEFIKSKLEILNPFKSIPAAMKALQKARETKDKGFFEKFGIFVSTFKAEMKGAESQEKDVKDKTGKEVQTSIDTGMDNVLKTINLKSGSEDDKKFHREVVEKGVVSLGKMDGEKRKSADSGLQKLGKAVTGKGVEKMTVSEATATAAVGLMTLGELRNKYPKKDEFKKALERFHSISGNSDYPLAKILAKSTLDVFKVDVGLGNAGELLAVAKNFGITGLSEGMAVKDAFAGLKERPMKNSAEVEDTLKKNFFPNSDVKTIADALNRAIAKDPDKGEVPAEVTIDVLTDIVFAINEADYEKLVKALGGNIDITSANA